MISDLFLASDTPPAKLSKSIEAVVTDTDDVFVVTLTSTAELQILLQLLGG